MEVKIAVTKLSRKTQLVRPSFPADTVFLTEDHLVVQILKAYQKAAIKAQRSAQHAVAFGELRYVRQAQFDEAVVATIENILTTVPWQGDGEIFYGMEDIELPNCPEF